MNRDKILEFVNEKESWSQVRGPDSDIMSHIRSKAVQKHQQMARMLGLFRMASAALAVLVIALVIGLFAGRSGQKQEVVLIYPATGVEKSVVVTMGKKDIWLDYKRDQQLFVKKVKYANADLDNLQVRIKSDENRNLPEYIIRKQNPAPEEQKLAKISVSDEDLVAEVNQDNELDGVYIHGMDGTLLAGAELNF